MKTISISEYAKKKGVSRQRIQALLNRGILTKEADGKIDPSKADRALQESLDPIRKSKIKGLGEASRGNRKSLLVEKTRLTMLQADKIDLELQQSRGETIEKETIIRAMDKLHLAFRSRLLSRSVKMAPILFQCETLVELQTALKDSDHECLTELASVDPRTVIESPLEG